MSSDSSPVRRGRRRGTKRRRDDEEEDEATNPMSTGDIPRDATSSISGDDGQDFSDAGGEDLEEAVEADYRAKPALDKYQRTRADEREYGAMPMEQRRAAEEQLNQRDQSRLKRARHGLAEADEDDDMDAGMADELARRRQRLRDRERALGEADLEEAAAADALDEEGPLREWLAQKATQVEVKKMFKEFLTNYKESGEDVYTERINNMCSENRQSLEVSYTHLAEYKAALALWLADAPSELVAIFNKGLQEVVASLYVDYRNIHEELYVRMTDLPVVESLRELRQSHLNCLVRVAGVITRRSVVFPQLTIIRLTCQNCQNVIGPFTQIGKKPLKVGSCPECQRPGPFVQNSEQSVYRNYQTVVLQESPGSVPAGRVPRYKEVVLTGDLIDRARPGDEVEVIGVYTNSFETRSNVQAGFPVFATIIEANNIQKREVATVAHAITDEDKATFAKWASDPNFADKVIRSIAPSVYGLKHAKTAVAMAVFGGTAKMNKQTRIRGDINVLLLGDPGTAKSQLLKYVEATAPRAVFTTGKGASAVGLTASVHKDVMTGEYTLEGGALVLADRGVCLIDEFDKMNDQDRTSIHEAMEQQTISISKAGIVTSLQARCSVIAAANPIGGRYDASKTFMENVELTDPIVQRFDILCVLQDSVDNVRDTMLANFVVGSHVKSHPLMKATRAAEGTDVAEEEAQDVISQDMLRKYILHARETVVPQFRKLDMDKLTNLYAALRQASVHYNGVLIAVRHLQSIMRMAEARARMRLQSVVDESDVDAAIATMLESFFQSQKFSQTRKLRLQFAQYMPKDSDNFQLILHQLGQLASEHRNMRMLMLAERGRGSSGAASGSGAGVGAGGGAGGGAGAGVAEELEPLKVSISLASLKARTRDLGITDLKPFLSSHLLKEHNYTAVREGGVVTRIECTI